MGDAVGTLSGAAPVAPTAVTEAPGVAMSAAADAIPLTGKESPAFSPPANSVREFLKAHPELALDDESPADDAAAAVERAETLNGKEKASKAPANPLPKVEALYALAKEGKFDELLKALEIDPKGLEVPSSRYAEFRKLQKAERDKTEKHRQSVLSYEAQVKGKVDAVLRDFAPFVKAKEAWDAGDVVGAIEAAFGEPLESVSDKALKQKLASDPETIKLRRRLEAKERAEAEAQEKAKQEAARRDQQAQETKYLETLRTALGESEDPAISAASKHRDFAKFVYRAQLHAWNTQREELTADEAAAKALKVIREDYDLWTTLFDGTGSREAEQTSEAGTKPQNTAQAGTSPGNQRKPKGVSQVRAAATLSKPTAEMTEDELLAHYKKRITREAQQEMLASGE